MKRHSALFVDFITVSWAQRVLEMEIIVSVLYFWNEMLDTTLIN